MLIMFLCSDIVSGILLSKIVLLRAYFAALSAVSFPCIPTCAGVHTSVTLFPLSMTCLFVCSILDMSCGCYLVFCVDMACMELRESVNIDAVGLLSVSVACTALCIAMSSVVYTEWWFDSLAL